MSRTPRVLFAALSAGLLCSAAAAQSVGPFAGADCREAKLDRVTQGRVQSTDTVIICKRTDEVKAALEHGGARFAAAPARPEPTVDRRKMDHVVFTAPVPSDRECAMLNCPTYILTGVGD
ncbi:hypothetical protein [Roseiarcus sp.]|uniref:hypothetical protein n=1 Tax=Roseiarcus sp. TaxID=1969460 RepID=UPI003F9810BA